MGYFKTYGNGIVKLFDYDYDNNTWKLNGAYISSEVYPYVMAVNWMYDSFRLTPYLAIGYHRTHVGAYTPDVYHASICMTDSYNKYHSIGHYFTGWGSFGNVTNFQRRTFGLGYREDRPDSIWILLFDSDGNFLQNFLYTKQMYDEWAEGVGVQSTWDDDIVPRFTDIYDPLEEGQYSDTSYEPGKFDDTTTPVAEIDTNNLLSAVNTGFITMYEASVGELNQLATFMWSTNFFELIQKLFTDPMECIISLKILPVSPPSTTAQSVVLGNVVSTVIMDKINSQYVTANCGSIILDKYWASALDYSGYTRVQMFLPFIGGVNLDVDKIMGKTLKLQYVIDILSGCCVAQLITEIEVVDGTTGEVTTKNHVIGNWEGNCAMNIPTSAGNYVGWLKSFGSIAGSALMMASIPSGAMYGGMTAMGIAMSGSASAVNSIKPDISMNGSMSGNSGYLGCRTPYIQITRPRQCLPKTYKTMEGYPANISVEKMEMLSGYSVISSVHLEGIKATSDELDEIESLLKEGVIF